VALQHAGADQCGDDVDQPHLEGRHAGEHRGAANLAGDAFARPWRGRRESMEVQWQLHLLDGVPQRLPDRMPHRLHVPGAGQFQPLDAHLRDPVDLRHRVVDVAVGQARKTDLTVRVVAPPAPPMAPLRRKRSSGRPMSLFSLVSCSRRRATVTSPTAILSHTLKAPLTLPPLYPSTLALGFDWRSAGDRFGNIRQRASGSLLSSAHKHCPS
jgi:hypothetical protein